ncbi:MAG: hypothetical protein M1561_00800 [Gammaproteobacteria bacterium]|nr:hypothetical protein [Gammaproteobacteria bacterium]
MNIAAALILMLFGGIINGSFALPSKHMTKWRFENVWINYALWAFIILPWLVMWFLAPQILQIYLATPMKLILVIIFGGFLFGVGQMFFALAIDMIGIGLAFVINLGLGIGLGFALPLIIQHPEKIATPFGIVTLAGTILAIIGLVISNQAGILRDREKNRDIGSEVPVKTKHMLGVILAAFAGLSSASQNFIFSYTYSMHDLATGMGANQFAAANIIWPGYLLCGFIPYFLYMLYLHFKNRSFSFYAQSCSGKYIFFALIMGIFWYGSLLFYSKASQIIGALGPIIGWPLFMVLIILSSSFWGWKHNEWEGCGEKPKKVMKFGLIFLVAAVIVLGYSSSINI